jgi:sialate O-acetylesterase
LEREFPWRKADGAALGSGAIYNAMIHPISRSRIRGAIWYQGESDASRAERYRVLLKNLIQSWRVVFGAPDLPFGIVQLPAYKERQRVPADDDWAELRDAQLGALELPNTGLAVTLDLGDADNIHPRRKRDVGGRLALWALARAHGQVVQYSGPIAIEHRVDGASFVVRFTHARGLRANSGVAVRGFQIAGADRRFVWANAAIDGESVRVSHPEVPVPVALRYAWAANPDANLENEAGLLASPFRTDQWPGVTTGQY